MALFKPIKNTAANIANVEKKEGQFLIATDTGEAFVDINDTTRVPLRGAGIKPTTGYVIYPGDGKRYPVKKIGGVWYTVKNHDSTVYADGSLITMWGDTYEGARFISNTLEEYGKLYTWPVTQQANLCPAGWKVPSKDDFEALVNFLGSTADEQYNGLMNVNVWKGVLGGYYSFIGYTYQDVGAYYWSSVEYTDSDDRAYYLAFYKEEEEGIVDYNQFLKEFGCALRFIIEDESLIQYDDAITGATLNGEDVSVEDGKLVLDGIGGSTTEIFIGEVPPEEGFKDGDIFIYYVG
jgi:uncharacterized protein (TIGR02145 family)